MLAVSLTDLSILKYPVLVTPKLDGIRCLKVNGQALTRKFKEIPNQHIRELIEQLPDGLDGEIMIPGKTFNEIQSLVMTEGGTPDFEYWVFDYVEDLKTPYSERIKMLPNLTKYPNIIPLISIRVYNETQLMFMEKQYVNAGYEGIMIRSLDSPYKCGRSTLKEGYLLKLKRMQDSEAIVLGFEEKLENQNEKQTDELGYTKRTSHKANLIPTNTLGSLLVKDIKSSVEFSIGTGFTQEEREQIWNNKDIFLNKIVTYTHQPSGQKEKPRFPSFKGFRDKRDMD